MNKDRLELTELIREFDKFRKKQLKQLKDMRGKIKDLDSRIEPSTLKSEERDDYEYDDLYNQAREVTIEAGRASTSYLQRKLRIGYAQASRLMDMLEKKGVIGKAKGSIPRVVLIK